MQSGKAEESPPPPYLWKSWRGVIVYLCFLCNTCLYLCRTSITVAIVYMYKDYRVQGFLLTGFYVGYTLSQMPGGWAAKRYGAKPVLSLAVFVWSVVTILTVYFGPKDGSEAAAHADPVTSGILFTLRLIVGLAEGVNYPCQMALNTAWIPRRERARTWTFGVGGEPAGTILALLGGPFLIEATSTWRSVFIISGAVGFAWLALFFVLASSTPEDHRWISQAELDYIRSDDEIAGNEKYSSLPGEESAVHPQPLNGTSRTELDPEIVPWKEILSNRAFQCTVFGHICYNYGYYVVLSWITDYFKTKYKANYGSLGMVSILPYVLLLLTNPGAGFFGDWLEKKGFSTLNSRRIVNSIAMFGASIGFVASGIIAQSTVTPEDEKNNLYPAAIVLAVTVSVGGLMVGGIWSNFRDLSDKYAPILIGISNSIASLPGIIGQGFTGWLLAATDGNWFWVFCTAGIIECIGAFVFLVGAKAEDQKFGERRG